MIRHLASCIKYGDTLESTIPPERGRSETVLLARAQAHDDHT
jgi:hypothetical protein